MYRISIRMLDIDSATDLQTEYVILEANYSIGLLHVAGVL